MKKIIVVICMALTVMSCSDDFIIKDSLTQIADENFWKSESDAFLALNGVYSALQSKSLYGGNLNGYQGYPAYDCLGDNAYNQYEWEGLGTFMEGTVNTTDGPALSNWTELYRGITRANAVIKNTQNISEDLISAETKKSLLGQAYFLRALFYFNLAVYYESAPLITEPQTLENAYMPKNSYEEITAQIVADLKLAISGLPVSHPANLQGYATKGAALGLFTRVQLYNKEYDGEFGVLSLTSQAMTLGYDLYPNYAGLFTPTAETSNEVVFAVRFLREAGTNNGETFSATYNGSPKVDSRPMPNLVNDYYCTDGKPITTSPLYNPAKKGLNRDPRANGTIYFVGDLYLTNPVMMYNGSGATKFGHRKYIRTGPDAEGNSASGDGSQDFYVIRYADILLMRAEAMAEKGDISGATALINTIRARVSMPTVQAAEGTVNKTQMIAIVRHERRVELALEGLRFMDLKRWGKMEEAFQRASGDIIGPYSPQYLGRKSETFPIPQNEIDVNPKLIQNTPWQ